MQFAHATVPHVLPIDEQLNVVPFEASENDNEMLSTHPTAPRRLLFDESEAPSTFVHAVAIQPQHAAVDHGDGKGIGIDRAAKSDGARRNCRPRTWLLGLGVAAVVVVPVILLRDKFWFATAGVTSSPSPAPTAVGDGECRKKRIRIAEVCDVPELDDEGEAMEIKVLVNDQHYWPGRVEADCMEGYGSSGGDSCVVPDSSLVRCFPLRNSAELAFGPGGAPVGERIKVTIRDSDFLFDDSIDIFARRDDWHRPNLCERKELEFTQYPYEGSATIKMVVDFGEAEDPCGVEQDDLISGLDEATEALENVQLGLLEYARGGEPDRRRLVFPLLATGFRAMAGAVATGGRSFVRLFTRRTRAGDALSTAADMTQIGSLLFSILGNGGEDSASPDYDNHEALFDKVFDRFDEIDSQLDSIQVQIQDGFEAIKLVIEEEFAQQELDDWVLFRLNIKLRGDYQAYMERGHSVSSRTRYEDAFRETCNGDYSPYNVFQVLYSYSCLGCRHFGGQAKNHFLDTYVRLARANFETPTERVLWFRRSFGTVIVGAMTEAIYLHSACLHGSKDECEAVDPVWDARLEEMGDALEEIVDSLSEAETKLE